MRIIGIYSDKLKFLQSLGETVIKRASHVEPEGTHFYADMHPVGGPKLGPFDTHAAAIEAEIAWIKSHPGCLSGDANSQMIGGNTSA